MHSDILLCCTPEINTTLYINYTSIKNKKLKKINNQSKTLIYFKESVLKISNGLMLAPTPYFLHFKEQPLLPLLVDYFDIYPYILFFGFFVFLAVPVACGISVPQPGTEPGPWQ